MNILVKSITRITNACFTNPLEGHISRLSAPLTTHVRASINNIFGNTIQRNLTNLTKLFQDNAFLGMEQARRSISLYGMHKRGPRIIKKRKVRPLDGKPFAKGVILRTIIKKPKKPNSANRKCCIVKLSTGKVMTAFIPGIGHNLQEHNIVLVKVGGCKDVPGVKIRCVRGKYDLPHVVKPTS